MHKFCRNKTFFQHLLKVYIHPDTAHKSPNRTKHHILKRNRRVRCFQVRFYPISAKQFFNINLFCYSYIKYCNLNGHLLQGLELIKNKFLTSVKFRHNKSYFYAQFTCGYLVKEYVIIV